MKNTVYEVEVSTIANQDLQIEWVKNLSKEFNLTREDFFWETINNPDIILDYKPMEEVLGDFYFTLVYSGEDKNKVDFFAYLVKQKQQNIDKLETNLLIEIKDKNVLEENNKDIKKKRGRKKKDA